MGQYGPQPKLEDLSTEEQLFWRFAMTPVALAIKVAIAQGKYSK